MRFAQLWIAAAIGGALACATRPTPVTVAGESAARASLAGKWVGEYSSPTTGRTGSIVFNLAPSGDAANGDVVMVPRGYGKALQPYHTTGTGVNADTIEGTFSTTGRQSAGQQTGTWRVKRSK